MIVGSGPAPFLPRPPIGTTGTLPAPPPLLWGARPVLAPGILAALWGGGNLPPRPQRLEQHRRVVACQKRGGPAEG